MRVIQDGLLAVEIHELLERERRADHVAGHVLDELALAQAALYLALAPKSNVIYTAYGEARRTVEERPADPVPMSIRNAPTRLMKGLGYGAGYVYAHGHRGGDRRPRLPP